MAPRKPQHGASKGDMIEIFREHYEDWAIYVDNDEVVYLTLTRNKSSGGQRQATVKCGNIWDVTGSDDFEVKNCWDEECNPRKPDFIVKEARQMVGQEWSCSSTSRLPEHFVKELRYGKARQHGAKPGDLIEIDRGNYQHWAVYVGDDMVVHLVNEGSGYFSGFGFSSSSNQAFGKGLVKKSYMWEVIGSCDFKINNLLDKKHEPLDPQVIVKEALAQVGKKLQYSVTSFNCEHFATQQRYGKKVSIQVNKAANEIAARSGRGAAVGAASGAAVGAAAVAVGAVGAAGAAAVGGAAVGAVGGAAAGVANVVKRVGGGTSSFPGSQ